MLSGVKKVFTKDRSLLYCFTTVMNRILPVLCVPLLAAGCVSQQTGSRDLIAQYQESMSVKGPQARAGSDGFGIISPAANPQIPDLKELTSPSEVKTFNLSLEDAVVRSLANSPEITVVSYDPSITKEGIGIAVSEFDITAFGDFEYDNNDIPSNDISQEGKTHSGLWEAGVKQKGITGGEWRLAYALTRTVDNSLTRIFPTSYEPALTFELKQPLLRDAWMDVNLAGVNVSKLNYKIALANFHDRAEDVSTQVISLYWTLLQARHNVEIQKGLLEKTNETLRKVEERKDIDATVGDIKQAETSARSREASLFEAEKNLSDVQDRLVRLLADHQMNLVSDLEIIPTTEPNTAAPELDQDELIPLALKNNPAITRANLEVEVEEINLRVAEKQQLPRLDLVASAQVHGLSDSQGEAQEVLSDGDYVSYALGLTLEYPLGNREKKAKLRQNKLKHLKAVSNLQNISDQVATAVREKIRLAETAHQQIQVQKDAVKAAEIHLQSLEDIETVRKKLTPEFLLAKIQAQEALANAQRAEIKAVVDYNIGLIKLAQVTGKVLAMGYIK